MKEFNKITIGFVIQHFKNNEKGKFVCDSQEFIAGDQVDYEDGNNEPLSEIPEHIYQEFNMTVEK